MVEGLQLEDRVVASAGDVFGELRDLCASLS